MGYSPTLVSPDSIDRVGAVEHGRWRRRCASARVRRRGVIIDSSIWVATMTGFALRRASSMIASGGTARPRAGHSTPRSPAGDHEAVEGVDDLLVDVVDRLGLLDLGDDREETFSSRITARTSSTSPRCARSSAR
jgi:hypothetical protein